MAGGAGTRFWPLSRNCRPKQLLSWGDGDSLLVSTVRRLQPLIPTDRILVVTSARLVDEIKRQLPELQPHQILAEPVARNTAPCVAWAASRIARDDPKAVMMVLPSDHYIADEDTFRSQLRVAIEAASSGYVVTLGVPPTRPDTGYGYIERGENFSGEVYHVQRFVEKPDLQRAMEFLKTGRFLWNSGMFFFKAETILEAMDAHLPNLNALARKYQQATLAEEAQLVNETFASAEAISLDHGIIERIDRVLVIPARFVWSDVGSWGAAWQLAPKDEHGNSCFGSAITIDARNCYIRTASDNTHPRVIALVGVEDLVVVDTGDALLVLNKHRDQDVKALVDILRQTHPELI